MKHLEMRKARFSPTFSRNPLCYLLGHELKVGVTYKYGGYTRVSAWCWRKKEYVDILWSCARKGCRKEWDGANQLRE